MVVPEPEPAVAVGPAADLEHRTPQRNFSSSATSQGSRESDSLLSEVVPERLADISYNRLLVLPAFVSREVASDAVPLQVLVEVPLQAFFPVGSVGSVSVAYRAFLSRLSRTTIRAGAGLRSCQCRQFRFVTRE